MDPLSRLQGFGKRWLFTLAYLAIVIGTAANFAILNNEIHRAKRVDEERRREICVVSRETINERFMRLDKLLVSFGDPRSPKALRFLAEEQASELDPRKC